MSSSVLQRALLVLESGGVVAIPTETVYGLAGDATRREAVERIYAVKGRPLDHPVIVHLGSPDWLSQWADPIPDKAWELVKRFWPGPLTLVLKRAPGVGDWITGGQDTVGLRMPAHPLTLELLQAFGRGLAAPSANRFGRVSPTTAQHVRDDLGDEVEVILDGGPCQVGLESTILDLSGEAPRLLRPGHIGAASLQEVVGPLAGTEAAPRAPGTLKSHYAPQKTARFFAPERDSVDGYAVLTFGSVALKGRPAARETLAEEPGGAARQLYGALRRLDQSVGEQILIAPPPGSPDWDWVRDRLNRAVSA